MDARHAIPVAVFAMITVAGPAIAQDLARPDTVPHAVADPGSVFDPLGDRYRGLTAYEDTVEVVEIITRGEQRRHRVETRLTCRIENDRLHVDSPGGQVRSGIGLGGPVSRSAAGHLIHGDVGDFILGPGPR